MVDYIRVFGSHQIKYKYVYYNYKLFIWQLLFILRLV